MTKSAIIKSEGQFISNLVLVLVIFSYFDLFQFIIIPYQIRLASSMVMSLVLVLMILLKIIYQPGHVYKMNFVSPILLLILGSFPSYFIAKYYHSQDFLITFYANRILWFYLLYFYVHLYKISVSFIIKLIVITGLIAVGLFYIQYIIYPAKILQIKIFKERNTLRMFIPGMICTITAYFYFLDRFLKQNRLTDFFLSLLCISTFILQGTRVYIYPMVFLTLIFIIFVKRIRGKFLLVFLVFVAVISLYFVFKQIFIELTKVSSSQVSNISGNVRIRAANFYLTDYMPGWLAYVFGNGTPGPGSLFGQRSIYYNLKFGYYITDIGIIGDYVKFGILFILGGLIMFVKSLTFKISHEYNFLKYHIMCQCFTLLTGYGLLGGVDVVIVLILYVFDVNRSMNSETTSSLNISPYN
jgi:hypothetical protein